MMPPLLWLALFLVLTSVGAVGVVVNVNSVLLIRRTDATRAALLAAPHSAAPNRQVATLPPPVARYRALAVGERAPVHTLRLRHGGTFRMSPAGRAFPIQGNQLFTADPPGFVWLGQVHLFPGVWVDACDVALEGQGSMRVFLEDTVTLFDVEGPEMDQGAALRLLSEMVWYPTALFDERTVSWAPVDATHATATLTFGEHIYSAVFEFGPDGLPLGVVAERFMSQGELRQWTGVYRDWRTVSDLKVPFEAEVAWTLPSGKFTYAHWQIQSLEFDRELTPGDSK